MTTRIPGRSTADRRDTDRTSTRTERSRIGRTEADLRDVRARLDHLESRYLLLDRTLRGIARETGTAIGCPCDRCGRSYLLITEGMMVCPACQYRQSV